MTAYLCPVQGSRITDYLPPETFQEIVALQLREGDFEISNRNGGYCGISRRGDDLIELLSNLTGEYAEMHKRREIRMPQEETAVLTKQSGP